MRPMRRLGKSPNVLVFFGQYIAAGAAESGAQMGTKKIVGLTGDYSDRTMVYLVGGAAAAVAGLGLLLFSGKR